MKNKMQTIADYQNYQTFRDTGFQYESDDNWVELGGVFRNPKTLIGYIKGNISTEEMERQQHIVEYWDEDLVSDADTDQVEWMGLEEFIEEYDKLTQPTP